MAGRIKPRCYQCGKDVRSMAEHLTTAGHRARTSSVRSSGPAGSHAYHRPATLPRPESEYDAMLEERYLASLPPSIDDVFPLEVVEPDEAVALERARAERGYRPAPCERCDKSFRTDAGRAWHLARNPRCEKWRPARSRKGVAA